MRSLLRWFARLLTTSPALGTTPDIAPSSERDSWAPKAPPDGTSTHPAAPDTSSPSQGALGSSPSEPRPLAYSTSFYEHQELAVAKSSFRVPTADVAPASLRWVAAGDTMRVQNHTITHGMLYIGSAVSSSEPSLINPRLRASKGASAPLGYWPNYAGMEPAARFQYLEWLASGACQPIDIGYVFVFFYGLERRLLVDGGSASEEAPRLLAEIERLLSLYGSNLSFKNYATSLLEFCRHSQLKTVDGLTADSCTSVPSYVVPFLLRVKLGVMAREASPVPSEWAHCWALADPLLCRRTPVTRCPDEFKRAFASAYSTALGDGLVLPRNKTTLKAIYQPASAGLRGAKIEINCDIPDVLATTAPRQKLQEVVDTATVLIETYSRCLSRNQDRRGQIVTLVNLPVSLWPEELLRTLQQLRQESEAFPAFTCANLLARLGYEEAPTTSFVASVWKALEEMGIGMEPDVSNGVRRPKPEEILVLFQLQSKTPIGRKSARYAELSLKVSLAACLALADGHACDRELAQIEQMIAAADDLDLDLRTRLRAQYRLQIRKPSSVAALRSKLQSVPGSMRLAVATTLSSLATSDGAVSPEEVRFLESIYKTLHLDPQLVYAHLYSEAPHHTATKGSEKEMNASTTSVIGLDLAKITRLQAETAQVSALLTDVFTEIETESIAPAETITSASTEETPTAIPALIPGLDSVHNQFLLLVLTRAQWSREDLLVAASDMQLMLDGALERLNEAALDATGESLLEGDDPVHVQQVLLEAAEA